MTAAPVLAKTLRFKLVVSSGEKAGESFEFEKSAVLIGRGPENDMVFSNDPKMSRTHVEIRQLAGQVIVRNISQKNLLLVNGEKVEEKTLIAPATIQVGETILQYQPEVVEAPSQGVARAVLAPQVRSTPPPPSKKQDFSVVAPAPKMAPAPAASPAPTPSAYTPPRPSAPGHQRSAPKFSASTSGGDSSRLRFYIIVCAVGALVYWFVSSNSSAKKTETQLRTEGDVVRAIEDSAQVVKELRKQQETSGQDSLQYKAAQEHYIKGFRDYRQGQYSRAMQSFQAALSFYPNHELARKYLLQSQRKFEAQIDFNLAQGRKYYQKQNYKMCQSSFASVMMMVKDSTKLKYKEAKQLYDECGLRGEGGY